MTLTRRAVVGGAQSCGCLNLVQDAKTLKGGAVLTVSGLGYRPPKGVRIEGAGVTPDRVVAVTIADLRGGRDAALAAGEAALRDAVTVDAAGGK